MLWDGKSKGTLQNILKLIGAGKPTLVYFGPMNDFHKLTNETDLQLLLARRRKDDLELAVRGLWLKHSLTQTHLPMVVLAERPFGSLIGSTVMGARLRPRQGAGRSRKAGRARPAGMLLGTAAYARQDAPALIRDI